MIHLFTISSNDQSVFYLFQIFGYVGNILPPASVANLNVTTAPIILGTMFKTFNTVVLAVGALIVLYVTVVGVLKTAHEGEFLGREWNKLWVPLRMVLGIVALVPTPSGYSIIQIIMMWVILQGVGAADTVWTTVLQYTRLMGSPLATLTIPSVGVSVNMQNLYQMLTCQATARASYDYKPVGTSDGKYYCYCSTCEGNVKNESFCTGSEEQILNVTSGPQVIQNPLTITYLFGPSGACGSMTFCNGETSGTIPGVACLGIPSTATNPNQLSKVLICNTCKAQDQVLQSIVGVLGAIASKFAAADYNYRVFYNEATGENKNAPDFVGSYCSANNIGQDQCCVPSSSVTTSVNQTQQQCAMPTSLTAGDPYNAATETVQQLYLPHAIQSATGNTDFVTVSTDNYISAINNAILSTVQQQVSQQNLSRDTTWIGEAQRTGWIFAGAYYYKLAKNTDQNLSASIPLFSTAPTDPRSDTSSSLYTLRSNFTAAGALVNQLSSQSSTPGDLTVTLPPRLQSLSKLTDGLNTASKSVMRSFMSMVTGARPGELATDPLASLQMLGKILLIIAQVLFGLILIVIPLITLIGFISPFVLGTGATNPIGPTVSTLAILFAPLFALFMGFLFIFGASLAIYIPLIPYIIFTMGAIAWFILVIEAMVAAPLVALGILSPSAQHELLGKADQAVFYAFGIFLRPTLMIFGMIAAMLLSIVVVTMINAAFSGVMGSVYSNPGIVETIFFLAAYVSLVIAALNKAFALIHIIPDTVLRWIGHQGGAAGEAAGHKEALGAVEGGVKAAGEQMQAMGKEAAKQAQKAAEGWGEFAQAQKAATQKGAKVGMKKGGGEGGPPPEMPPG